MKEAKMAIQPTTRVSLAQNFLLRPSLVRELVAESSLDKSDTVLEIGAGSGIITAELARIARRVIAVEIDPGLVHGLRRRFQSAGNVTLVAGDYLGYTLPVRDYKLFGNIPFNRSADMLRKILYAPPLPQEACLILQKEAAEKFAGYPRETQFSLLIKPWFELVIVRALHRTDFTPVPAVESVLLRIVRRPVPLVRPEARDSYERFVRYGFGTWRRSLKCTFKQVFSYKQWKRLSRGLGFALNATPTDLSFEQWLGLFEFLLSNVKNGEKGSGI
jgi:23S rRNA (adenine-N6)-dimethyltransferase